jgi:3-dehydroquinate synthase
MGVVNVDLGSRSYNIFVASNIEKDSLLEVIAKRRVFVISDDNVAPLYLEKIKNMLGSLYVGAYVIPSGEASKSLQQSETVMGEMIRVGMDRKSLVLALGGGVVGDLAGFVASTYMRGIEFLQVPTTLLAMVDSSVGGKVAVNHPMGKNMIGQFHQPIGVWIAMDTLSTLQKREIPAGIAEIIKYGVIWDADFFSWLEEHLDRLLALDHEALIHAIEVSVKIKAEVVSKDEKEGGLRAILNYGHTFAHAEELLSGYGEVLHGEAVGAGMVAASSLAQAQGTMSKQEVTRIHELVKRSHLPVSLKTSIKKDDFWQAMQGDKKSLAGVVKFVIAPEIGSCHLPEAVERDLVERVLAELY